MHRTRNAAYGQPYRGFESLPLRQYNKINNLAGIISDRSGGDKVPRTARSRLMLEARERLSQGSVEWKKETASSRISEQHNFVTV